MAAKKSAHLKRMDFSFFIMFFFLKNLFSVAIDEDDDDLLNPGGIGANVPGEQREENVDSTPFNKYAVQVRTIILFLSTLYVSFLISH